jgi:hypothetical protein
MDILSTLNLLLFFSYALEIIIMNVLYVTKMGID